MEEITEEERELQYLYELQKILQDCLTGAKRKHAVLLIADDDTQVISMFSANANDYITTALLIAARTHLEIDAMLNRDGQVVH